jgi:O-antigen/teichoic acid export membrane protein
MELSGWSPGPELGRAWSPDPIALIPGAAQAPPVTGSRRWVVDDSEGTVQAPRASASRRWVGDGSGMDRIAAPSRNGQPAPNGSVEGHRAPDGGDGAGHGSDASARIGRNLAALLSGQLVTWTMTLAWTVVVPRLLGPAAIGLIVTAMSATGILAIALGFGTKNYLVRAIVVTRGEASRLVATATVLRLMLAPLFLAVLIGYAHFAHYGHDGTVVLYLAGGATILTLLQEPMQATFQAVERMEYLALSDVINKSAQGLLGIALAVMGFGAVGFAACWMVMSGVVLVLDAFWLRRHVRLQIGTTVRRLGSMAKESMAYWAAGMFFMIYLWIDTVMLSLMTNPTVVGWYGLPTRLFQTMMFIPVLMSTAWLPRLVKVFEKAPRELQRTARTPVELVVVLGLPIAAAVAVTAGPIIHLLYGSAYDQAVPVMIILGLCIPPMYLNIMLSQVVVAARRQVIWTWLMAAATFFNPTVNAMLIPLTQHRWHNGAIGAAIALLLTELLIVCMGIAVAGRSVVGARQIRRFALAAVASAGMWAASYLSRGFGTVPSVAIGCAALLILTVVLRLITPAEIAYLRTRVGRLAPRMPPGPIRWLVARIGLHDDHVPLRPQPVAVE